MDHSGNNSGGSMQSSSGGDEEYDSRVGSISPFFNPSTHFGSTSNHPIPHQSNLFDPQSHNLVSFLHSPTNPNQNPNPNPNALYNLDSIWSRGPRSDPNHTQLGNPNTLSSPSSSSQAVLGLSQGPLTTTSTISDQLHVVKTSKKRTRASRRAPTTVLTTDMSNFRQMVQEFTGIPAAPFSSSPFSRRLDLFAAGSSMRCGPLEPLYRAAAAASVQKVQPSSFLSTSSSSPSFLNSAMVDSITSTTTTNINPFNPSNNSYQLPSDHRNLVPKQPQSQNLTNFQNPILTFQSLQFQFPPPSVFGSKSQTSSTIPSIHDLGLGHEHLNSTLKGYPTHENSNSRSNNGGDHRQEQVGSFEGQNGNSQHVGYNPEKGLLENVSSRGEGTVDSFFCAEMNRRSD